MSKVDPKKPDSDPELKGLFDTIGSVELGARSEAIGRVTQISDGLAAVSGLGAARLGEMLEF
ncbi:MAG: F0F1 ATP synthase subunit alpha, partial [Oricola sp.]|nr:F0F1 ATP synthase subunit alpha [Oricola sp.]